MNAIVRVETHLKTNIQWMVKQSGSSSRWIGVCEPLGQMMEADSLDELHSIIEETMQLLFTDLLLDNELDAFLRSKGWTARNLQEASSADDVTFDVPWDLIVQSRSSGPERRAS
jgi:hypothetical protein